MSVVFGFWVSLFCTILNFHVYSELRLVIYKHNEMLYLNVIFDVYSTFSWSTVLERCVILVQYAVQHIRHEEAISQYTLYL